MKLLAIILLLASCGQNPSDLINAAGATPPSVTTVVAASTSTASVVSTDTKPAAKGEKGEKGDKGDKGDAGAAGAIGTAGIAGVNGKDGAAGKDGISGLAGKDGAAGAQGPAGIQGTQGAQGIQGIAGTSAQTLSVIDSANNQIGQLYEVDASNNIYWTVNGNLRMRLDATQGILTNAYLVFSGTNCTGTMRMVIVNGEFANTFVDGRDNTTVIKATGANLGTFNYQSRVAMTSNCGNTSGSTLVSWSTTNPSLGFAYPIGRIYIQN